AGTVLDPVALRQALRRQDVALLAVQVVEQRDARGAVGVVLDVRDLRRDAVLVVTAEVDDAVRALVAATLVADGHAAGVVTTTLAVQGADQRLLRLGPRDLDEVGDTGATTARCRRLVLADAHGFFCPRPLRTVRTPASGDRTAEDVDAVALDQRHDGALGVLALAEAGARALALALPVQRVDVGDLDREDRFHGLLDLRLVGVRRHDERVLVLVEEAVALLRDDRLQQHVTGVRERLRRNLRAHQAALPSVSAEPAPVKRSNAAWVKTTSSETSTSYVLSWPASRMCTFGRLRAERTARCSSRSLTTSSRFFRSLIMPNSSRAALVDGVSASTTPVTTWTRSWRARSVRAPRRAALIIFFGVRCE